MSLSRDSRQEKKLKAMLRAQFALKQRFERIDFEEDTVNPLMEDYKAGRPVLGLSAGAAFDLEIVDTPGVVHENPTDDQAE